MKQKLLMIAPVLLLGGTTISNGTLTLDTTALSWMGTAMTNAGISMVTVLMNMAPYLIGLMIAWMVFTFISGLIKPKS